MILIAWLPDLITPLGVTLFIDTRVGRTDRTPEGCPVAPKGARELSRLRFYKQCTPTVLRTRRGFTDIDSQESALDFRTCFGYGWKPRCVLWLICIWIVCRWGKRKAKAIDHSDFSRLVRMIFFSVNESPLKKHSSLNLPCAFPPNQSTFGWEWPQTTKCDIAKMSSLYRISRFVLLRY